MREYVFEPLLSTVIYAARQYDFCRLKAITIDLYGAGKRMAFSDVLAIV